MLCAKVPHLEWSGVLFFTTEGTFGEDDFVITCQEVYPLDIGSPGYTEYETDDPEFIKWLMEDKSRLEMYQGHCHSHNTMPTFFSPTDDSELNDNVENHNIYVSLIVNNKNENCAKVAFAAKETTSVPGRKLVTEVKFKNEKGEEIIKQYTTETEDKIVEKTVMYTQECKIEYPSTEGGAITARFQQLLDRVTKREEEKKRIYEQNFKRDRSHTRNYSDFYPQAWNRPDTPDTRKPANRENEDKSKEKDRVQGMDTGARRRLLLIPENVSGRDLLKTIDKKNKSTHNPYPMSSVYTSLPKSTKQELYSMLGKLLALDSLNEDHLSKVMNMHNHEFYPQGPRTLEMRRDAQYYYDTISRDCKKYYIQSFPEDKKLEKYEETMTIAIEIVSTFDTHFPELAENIIEVIKDTFKK